MDKAAKGTKSISVKNQFTMQSKDLTERQYIRYSVSVLNDYIQYCFVLVSFSLIRNKKIMRDIFIKFNRNCSLIFKIMFSFRSYLGKNVSLIP